MKSYSAGHLTTDIKLPEELDEEALQRKLARRGRFWRWLRSLFYIHEGPEAK